MRKRKAGKSRPAYCTTPAGHRKIRYRTLKDAKTARSTRINDGGVEYLRIYKCDLCGGGYHLTSEEERTSNSTVWAYTDESAPKEGKP